MSGDNKEFHIPFEESRRGTAQNSEEKAAIGRLGRYLGSRAIDRPTIGDRRRNRGRGGFDLPTGGKPGTRRPTGSRRDIDGDGWADEGTTKPVWVGVDGPDKKPTRETAEALSSGKHNFPDARTIDLRALGENISAIVEPTGDTNLNGQPTYTLVLEMSGMPTTFGTRTGGIIFQSIETAERAKKKFIKEVRETLDSPDLQITALGPNQWEYSTPNNFGTRTTKRVGWRTLSSGQAPRYPRTPTLGAFLGKADEDFDGIDSWEKFKEIYDGKEIVFFDYETTGLQFDEFGKEVSRGVPVQFGAVKIKNGKEVGRINLFMNPGEPLGEWSRNNLKDMDGNPLTDEWLGSQMSVEEAHRQLIEFAGSEAIFGVQNAAFDKTVLDEVLSSMGEQWRPSSYLDTREIASLTLPKWTPENEDGPFVLDKEGNKRPSSSLAAITKYLGVELGAGHHNADADAFATSQVMKRIMDGAIAKGWSKDALNKNTRDAIHKPSVEKFNEELVQFEKDKSSYVEGLSSGRQRPLIPMRKTPERAPTEPGKRGVTSYGQKDASGREVRKYSPRWLDGMTPEEISRVVIPSSEKEHFEMWADDVAGPTWRTNRKWEKFLKQYYKELNGHENALKIDYSPESIAASRELVRGMLESSPQMLWMFHNYGSPMIGMFTRDAMNEYENRPGVKERMESLRQQRGMSKTPFVSGLASREFGFIGLTPRALIDRESFDENLGPYPLELNPNRVPGLREAHIDRSLHGTVIHEYGHWLHYRAIWDLETNSASDKAKSYYGSGRLDDPVYRAGLDVADEYANPDTDDEAIAIYSEFIDLTERDAQEMFRAHPDRALTATSYGNVNKREAIAEAFVAVMHPNKDMPKIALSPKLRRDIYALVGVDPDDLPWERRADGRPTIRLSSGATVKPAREKRRNRISRALRQLVGADEDAASEQQASPKERYEFDAPDRPEGLVSFAAEPSDALRESLPIPSDDVLRSELENDVKQIPPDPILEELSSLDIAGFGVSIFSPEEERRASSAAKRMLSLNISESADIDPREFVRAFSDEEIKSSGLDMEAQRRFFSAARNFRELQGIYAAIEEVDAMPGANEEDKKKVRRFAVDRKTGSIVPTERHDSEIKKRYYFDEIIDKLEERSFDDLFGPEWDNLTRIALGDDASIVSPYLITKIGGDEIKSKLTDFGLSIRGMLNDFARELRRETGRKRTDPLSGRPLRDDEGLALMFAPIGDIDPRTGKPGMALVSRTGTVSEAYARDFALLIKDGKLVPESERTDEQHMAYDRLYVMYGAKDGYLERIAEAGLFIVDEKNIDSPETKELFKAFLIGRLRAAAGNAEDFEKRYSFKTGISFFDIDTPEGQREAKAAIVSDIIHTWAISANNSNPVALAIQHEARKMFGLDDAVGWYGRVRGPRDGLNLDTAIPAVLQQDMSPLDFDDAPELTEKQSEILRSVIKAIYDSTQHYYKSKGITHVAVWRGMKGGAASQVPRGEVAARNVTMRPLSSWTTSGSMAQAFSTSITSAKKMSLDTPESEQAVYDQNLLMKAYVPVEQIFSNPLTGFGCLGEDEVVLLGRPTDTLMITPPANFLPEEAPDDATDDAKRIVGQTLALASERDKVTNRAYKELADADMDDFSERFNSDSSGALSSGANARRSIPPMAELRQVAELRRWDRNNELSDFDLVKRYLIERTEVAKELYELRHPTMGNDEIEEHWSRFLNFQSNEGWLIDNMSDEEISRVIKQGKYYSVIDLYKKAITDIGKPPQSSKRGRNSLSSGAQLSSVTETPADVSELSPDISGESQSRLMSRKVFAQRMANLLREKLGITLTEQQQLTIDEIMPNLVAKIDRTRVQEVVPHRVFSQNGKQLLDSISISIAGDGIPFVSADPIPQLAEQIPNKRDWRTIELPTRAAIVQILDEALGDSLYFDISTNEWTDMVGNVVARRVIVDNKGTLEYVDDAAKTRFPLLEALAPEGYLEWTRTIDNRSLTNNLTPGIYFEAWKKHREFVISLGINAGRAMGDATYFERERPDKYANNFLEAYIGGIQDPFNFNMGLGAGDDVALVRFHDLLGHLGTGRGFDRHGEWANDLAMMSIADHPDSPLTETERLAVKHMHFMLYAARRIGEGRLNESDAAWSRFMVREALDVREEERNGRPVAFVYAGDFGKLLKKMEDASTVGSLSSGRTKLSDAKREDIEAAVALDILGFKDRTGGIGNRSQPSSTGKITLSSGKVIKYNLVQARMRAADIKVTFNRDPERVAAVKATLQKGFMGGFTVEVDRMDDIKQGVAIARNKHGMKVDVGAEFDAEGNPSEELVDTLLSWMDFHGPKTFMEPKSGAERTTIGGWVSDGTLYLDVVDVYPDTEENIQKAAEMGKAEDQIAVTNLTKLWEYLGRGEDPSPAFIDSGGTGGFTLDEESVRRVSAALSDLNSNKANTGSSFLKRIGNTKTFTKGPVKGSRRVRHTDYATGEKQDYWIVAGVDGAIKVFTHEQYIKVRDKKIQSLFDKMSTQSDILASMFEAQNIKPVATASFVGGKKITTPSVVKGHRNRGLSIAMGNLYGFVMQETNIGIRMGDKVVAAMA